jgi:hypothetical protein
MPAIRFIKNYWFPIYLVLAISAVFYVKSVIKVAYVPVSPKQIVKKVPDVKPVKITLTIDSPQYKQTINQRLENTDTVADLLKLSLQSINLPYEISSYTYGIGIDNVGTVFSTDTYVWRVYHENKDITNNMNSVYLKDETAYTLNYELK